MNGEHLQDLRQRASVPVSDTNGSSLGRFASDELQSVLTDTWAVGMVLAAYDHELFHPYRPGSEGAWNATLQELLGARARILASVIPARLRSYRAGTLIPLAQVD